MNLSLTPDSFFLIILVTVLIIRIILHSAALLQSKSQKNIVPKLFIRNQRIHHYVYGLILCLVAILIKEFGLIAIGLGFIVDEVWLILGLQSDDKEYLSYSSLLGVLVTLLFLFILRAQVFQLIMRLF